MKIPGEKRVGAIISAEYMGYLALALSIVAIAGVAVTNLINGAAQQTSFQVTSYALTGYPTSGISQTSTLSFTLKNTGSTTFSIGTSALVTLAINTPAGGIAWTSTTVAPTSYAGTNAITFALPTFAATLTKFTWTGPSTAVSLPPGGTMSFGAVVGITGGSVNPNTSGTDYALTIQFGSSSQTLQVAAL
jgi:hypothetical protein